MERSPKLTPHQRQEALKRREAGESLTDIIRSRPMRACERRLPSARREPFGCVWRHSGCVVGRSRLSVFPSREHEPEGRDHSLRRTSAEPRSLVRPVSCPQKPGTPVPFGE
jgi:hypothetical protein